MKPKRLVRKIIKYLIDYSPENTTFLGPGIYVIYAVSRIGDGIACSIAINAFRKKNPNSPVVVFASKYNKAVFECYPNVRIITIYNEHSHLEVWKKAKELKKEFKDIECVFELSSSESVNSLFLMRALMAKKNLSYRTEPLKMIDNLYPIIKEKFTYSSVFESASNLLSAHGYESSKEPSFYVCKEKENEINKFITEKNIRNYITINLHGFDKKRKISYERAKDILNELRISFNNDIIILCTPTTSNEVSALTNDENRIYSYKDTSSIHHAAAIIKSSKYLITPDTSIVHIGSAYKIPTMALFCDERNPKMWPPLSENSSIIIYKSIDDINITDILIFLSNLKAF